MWLTSSSAFQNGLYSSLPNLCRFIMTFVFAFLCDFLIKSQWLSVTHTRKLSQTFCELIICIADNDLHQ